MNFIEVVNHEPICLIIICGFRNWLKYLKNHILPPPDDDVDFLPWGFPRLNAEPDCRASRRVSITPSCVWPVMSIHAFLRFARSANSLSAFSRASFILRLFSSASLIFTFSRYASWKIIDLYLNIYKKFCFTLRWIFKICNLTVNHSLLCFNNDLPVSFIKNCTS